MVNLFHHQKDSLIKFDSSIWFYNQKGLIEYIENWHFIGIAFDSPDQGMTTFFELDQPYLSSYFRSEYDEFGREVLLVFRLATSDTISRTRRFYNSDDKLERNISVNIKEYQFGE